MLRNSLVAIILCLAVDRNAQGAEKAPKPESNPAPNFQSQEFRSALARVLHARFDSFSGLKTGVTVFQLPEMSCSLSNRGNITSYLCSAPTSSQSEADKLYGSLTSAVAVSLHGYPLCQRPTVTDEMGLTSFCHYPKIFITDASVQNEKGVVSLEVFSREAGDRGEPAQFLHAYTLAELGRHAEAVSAFEPILGPGFDRHVYDLERHAYDAALKWTQDCAGRQSCMAADFLAIGKNGEAMRWQSQLFKNIRQGEKVNLRDGEELDPASAKSAILADAYDLNARIESAMGKLGPALRDLDSAFDALPKDSKAAPREATYYYHRALIFAENSRFADAAKACRNSLDIKDSNSLPGELRKPQCLEIYALASDSASGGVSDDFLSADSEQNGSIQAEIEKIARSNNYSPLPRPTVTLREPEGASDSPEWVVENGTQDTLHVLMSGPSDQRIDLAPGGSTSVSLPPGTYRVAARIDRSNVLPFYGEQMLPSGVKYTSHFVPSSN
jgi:hypothetical protein